MQCLLFSIFHVKFFFCSIVQKLITWAKCENLIILAKTLRKTDKSTRKLLHALNAFPNFAFVCFHWKIICHLGKVSKKVKTERVSNLIDAQFSCLGFTSFNVPFVYSLKRLINYCCKICTILCMIFKKLLFIEALCRPLFTKYAHCTPLFPFQNNA